MKLGKGWISKFVFHESPSSAKAREEATSWSLKVYCISDAEIKVVVEYN